MAEIRQFETGATRNLDDHKYDYEGFLSPLALREYAAYMHTHRLQKDGKMRDGDNWKKGIPVESYMKSMMRHYMAVWLTYRGYGHTSPDDGHEVSTEEALCALLFNVQGMLHELLVAEEPKVIPELQKLARDTHYYECQCGHDWPCPDAQW